MSTTCTMEQKSIRELVSEVKVHLAELDYRPSSIARLDAE